MIKQVESLNEPPKTQAASSMLKMAIASPPVSVLFAIIAYALCDRFLLPSAGTEQLKLIIAAAFLGNGAIGGVVGLLGLKERSLKLTDAKIKMQTPPDAPTVTNAGEVNIAAPDAAPTMATFTEALKLPDGFVPDDEYSDETDSPNADAVIEQEGR